MLADYLTGRGFSFKESANLLAEVAAPASNLPHRSGRNGRLRPLGRCVRRCQNWLPGSLAIRHVGR